MDHKNNHSATLEDSTGTPDRPPAVIGLGRRPEQEIPIPDRRVPYLLIGTWKRI